MPQRQRRTRAQALPTFGDVLRDIPYVFRASTTARFAICGLFGVLVYLFVGRMIEPNFTDYWWYQVFQTSITLVIVVLLNAAFADEGGMAIQTHVVVVGATLADTIGTAGHLYDKWAPYDKLVHFASGAAFAAGAYQAFNLLHRRGVLDWSIAKRGLIAACTSIMIAGVVWELYEYLSDALFMSGRVQSPIDTIGDLIADTLGAFTAVAVIYHYEWRYERNQESRAQLDRPVMALPEPEPHLLRPHLAGREREYALRHLPGRSTDD
jgi:uncharacterized membrane protein YjdF